MDDDATARILKLKNEYSYHPPKSQEIADNHEFIRNACLEFSGSISLVVPAGHEREMALDKLREVMFWSNAGIACNQS